MESKLYPKPSKPHITYRKGYWRVSPKPKPYHRHDKAWNAAHEFIRRLNMSEFVFDIGNLNGQGFYQIREAQRTWGRVKVRLHSSKIMKILDYCKSVEILRIKRHRHSAKANALNLLGLSRMIPHVISMKRDGGFEIGLSTNYLDTPVVKILMVPL